MIRIAAHRMLLTGAALAVAGVLTVGCGSQDSSSSASGPASAQVAASASPARSAASTPAARATRVPMQTASGGEFLSPSGNISCEVDYHHNGLTQVYCQTATPARSVTMGVTGTYKTCTSQQCTGNAGEGTPTLAYGTATGAGPFLCESATTGVTCTAGGRGFRISSAGIAPVSG